jgi:hypothetical protein
LWRQAFVRKYGREPNKQDAEHYRKQLEAQWTCEESDGLVRELQKVMREGLERAGVPKPAAASEAVTDWMQSFERKYGREPNDAEFDAWCVRWKELHGVA